VEAKEKAKTVKPEFHRQTGGGERRKNPWGGNRGKQASMVSDGKKKILQKKSTFGEKGLRERHKKQGKRTLFVKEFRGG